MSIFDKTFDVVVAGGGISGTMAAIAAAREERRTLLVERYSALGGMATLGLVQPITMWGINSHYVVGGTGKSLLEELARKGSGISTEMSCYGPVCDAEYLKMELETAAGAAGVNILYHTWVTGAEKNGDAISALHVFSKGGPGRIRGRVFVDATGDADVAVNAGVPCDEDTQGITLMMLVGGIALERCPERAEMSRLFSKHNNVTYGGLCCFRHPRDGYMYLNMTEVEHRSGIDPEDLTAATLECRRQAWGIFEIFRKHVPGFEHAYIAQTAPALGVRESRRIRGAYILTVDDALMGAQFEDAIARCSCPIDVHGNTEAGRHKYTQLKADYSIPYRSLIASAVPNLIVAGRCISADHLAHSSLRRMAPGFAIGEAAGTAAGMAVATGRVDSIDVPALQSRLKEFGGIIDPPA